MVCHAISTSRCLLLPITCPRQSADLVCTAICALLAIWCCELAHFILEQVTIGAAHKCNDPGAIANSHALAAARQ